MSKATTFNYLSKTAGVQVIKAGSVKMKDVSKMVNVAGLKSEIIDVPVTANKEALTVGFFTMEPGAGFEFTYEFLEYKVITKGKFVIRDEQGTKHVAEAGDVVLFTPNVTVFFEGESDGEAIYTKHIHADPAFM